MHASKVQGSVRVSILHCPICVCTSLSVCRTSPRLCSYTQRVLLPASSGFPALDGNKAPTHPSAYEVTGMWMKTSFLVALIGSARRHAVATIWYKVCISSCCSIKLCTRGVLHLDLKIIKLSHAQCVLLA